MSIDEGNILAPIDNETTIDTTSTSTTDNDTNESIPNHHHNNNNNTQVPIFKTSPIPTCK